jgi:WD40 repeat protein
MSLRAREGAGWRLAFAPGGTTLATGDFNASIYLWDTVTHKITAAFTDPSGGFLYWMAFAPGGTTLATSNGNGSIYLWDVATHKITATLTPRDKSITAVVFGPGGTTLATGGGNGSTYLWHLTKYRP